MDQASSLGKAQNPKMSMGDLVDRTSFAPMQINWADELVWFTEGRLFTPSGQHYGFLVVNQTTAKNWSNDSM